MTFPAANGVSKVSIKEMYIVVSISVHVCGHINSPVNFTV